MSLQCQQIRFFQTNEEPKHTIEKTATMLYVLPKVSICKKNFPFVKSMNFQI
jgi:hypothetical protein